jgi:hypothetical protein
MFIVAVEVPEFHVIEVPQADAPAYTATPAAVGQVIPPPEPHGASVDAIIKFPLVSHAAQRSAAGAVAELVVIFVPVPSKAFDEVTVVAVAAIGTSPAFMPDSPPAPPHAVPVMFVPL